MCVCRRLYGVRICIMLLFVGVVVVVGDAVVVCLCCVDWFVCVMLFDGVVTSVVLCCAQVLCLVLLFVWVCAVLLRFLSSLCSRVFC